MKKNICMCIIVVLCLALETTIFASTDPVLDSAIAGVVTPNFTNIILFQNEFDISGSGLASINSYLSVQGSDQLEILCELQMYSYGTWQSIKQWTETSSGTSAALSKTYYVAKGKLYRMKARGTAFKSGLLLEQTSFISSALYY